MTGFSKFSFLRRVRIHDGECGAVARALHHKAQKVALVRIGRTLISDEKAFLSQAGPRNVLRSTLNERKQMSTKTSIKRLALVAVSALGFGLLSVVPAKAAAGTPTLPIFLNEATTTVSVGGLAAVALDVATSTTAPGVDYDNGLITGSVKSLTVPASTAIVFGVTASGSVFGTDDIFDLSLDGTVVATAVGDAAITSNNLTYTPAATAAGTYSGNIKVYITATTRAAATAEYNLPFTLVVTAPSKFSSALSSALIGSGNAGAVASTTTDALANSGSATAATANRGFITMNFRNEAGVAMATGNTLTAQITSGPGYLRFLDADVPTADSCTATPTFGASVGRALSAQAVDALSHLIICADGTAGTATIQLSVRNQSVTTVWATKTFTFYGSPASLSVQATNFTIGLAGGDSTGQAAATRNLAGEVTNAGALNDLTTTPAFIIAAKDAAGQLATAASAPTVISSNLAVVASGSCVLDDGSSATYSSGLGVGLYNCAFVTAATAKSGDKATLTFRIANPLVAGAFLTVTADVTVGGARFTESLAFNKSSYAPAEAMVITRSCVDSSGNKCADGSSAAAIVVNKNIGGDPTTALAATTYVNGATSTSTSRPLIFAPAVGGAFEARMSARIAGVTSAVIATATVTDDQASSAASAAADAALEAIDAANAATDAANLAAEAADAATVAAEEARDAADAATAAVEALASEVATLIAGLKAQITTLANTVAKIAKRVRA